MDPEDIEPWDISDDEGEMSADTMEELSTIKVPNPAPTQVSADSKIHQTILFVSGDISNMNYVARAARLMESLNQADTMKTDIRVYDSIAALDQMLKDAKSAGYNQILVSYTP